MGLLETAEEQLLYLIPHWSLHLNRRLTRHWTPQVVVVQVQVVAVQAVVDHSQQWTQRPNQILNQSWGAGGSPGSEAVEEH